MAPARRPDRITGLTLAAGRDLPGSALRTALSQPHSAIDLLAKDFVLLWDRYRSGEVAERRIGSLQLASGAYVQWIGYSQRLVVECSSNSFLRGAGRLTAQEEATLVRAGFSPPDDAEPNFWLTVEAREDCFEAAFAVVAALTAVFGVFAG